MRCGTCCLVDMVALLAYVSDEDMERWQREGRDDIIHIIQHEEAVWAGDHLVSSRDGHYIHGCPFLKQEGTQFTCSIYETRPGVCRNYQPGSSEICPLFKK